MSDQRFPVLVPYRDRGRWPDLPRTVPWSLLGPHERRAKRNHDQGLGTLASRGGLSPLEMWLIVHDQPFSAADDSFEECTKAAVEWLLATVREDQQCE